MALKGDRQYVMSDISCFMNSAAERGRIVSFVGTGAGVSMDQAVNTVAYSATLSGVIPAGMLVQDVKGDLDLTKHHINFFKDEVPVGSKVAIVNIGEFTTNMVYPGHSPVPGGYAYLGHSGYIAASDVAVDHSDPTGVSRRVGRWATSKDEDGFARVKVNIP